MPPQSPLQPLQNFWHQLPLHRRGAIAASIPTLCLLLSLATFTWLDYKTKASQDYINYKEAILTESDELLVGLLNAETGMRGYRLTGQKDFLEPYTMAVGQVPEAIERLKTLTQDSPIKEAEIAVLSTLVQQRLKFLEARLLVPITQTPDATQYEESKIAMDQVRSAIAKFKAGEEKELEANKIGLQRQQALTTRVLWISAGVSAIGSLFAIYLFSQLEKELKLREQRLSESKTLIQSITTNVVDGILTLNAEGNIETFNPAGLKMFGYEGEELYDQPISSLLTNPTRSKDDSHYWQDPTTYTGARLQATGFRKEGKPFPIEVTVSDIPLEDRLIIIIRDMTEQQQAKADLRDRAQELAVLNNKLKTTNTILAARNQELNQFAYIASHDLKAPLRAIANLSEWLEEDLADQLPVENKQQMDLLRGRVHRMEALINGLLAYSRAGRDEVAIEKVNVAELLEEIIDLLAPPDTFKIAIAPDMPTFYARRLLLRQVFANLIDNAIKHHPTQNGQIDISVTEQQQVYEFSVADDGIGIAPQYHNKIFTIFQTLEARDKKESTGVGLSIVKKIVEAEGGTIRIESQVHKGATFFFTWLKSSLR